MCLHCGLGTPMPFGAEVPRREGKYRELLSIGNQIDMQRYPQRASQKQIPLDLELDPAGGSARDSALRAAYVRLRLSARLSFEQVMSDPAYAIGIRNLADAMARRDSAASPR
jgi:hypothetical protein